MDKVIYRDGKGRFALNLVKRFFRLCLAGSGMTVIILSAYFIGQHHNPVVVYGEKEVIVDNLEIRKGELKEVLLDKLQACESGGRNEEDGIVILDSNDVGSYGVLQFQRKTFMYYYEKMTGEKINGRDAIILALNKDKARDLARWIIFESGSGLRDWVNCAKHRNLTAELGFINSL